MMREEVASVDDGVSEGFVWVIHADLCTNTPPDALIGSSLHFSEVLEIIFDTVVPVP